MSVFERQNDVHVRRCEPAGQAGLLKVVQVIGSITRAHGGPSNAAVNLLRSASNRSVWIAELVTTDIGISEQERQSLLQSRMTFHHAGTALSRSLFVTLPMLRDVRRKSQDADVVLFHGATAPSILLSLLVVSSSPRLYVQAHGSLEPYEYRRWNWARRIFFKVLQKPLLQRARIVAATDSEAEGLLQTLPGAEVRVLPMGVDDGRRPATLVAPEQRLLASELLFVGRLAVKKRLDVVLEALAILNKTNSSPMRLVVIGDGSPEYRADLQKYAVDLGIADLVEWRGACLPEEIDTALRRSTFLCLPSENENFAHVVAEALVAGCPCVVTRHVALSKWVRDSGSGRVIDEPDSTQLAQAIAELVNDRRLYREVVIQAAEAGESALWSERIGHWRDEFNSNFNR